MPASATTTASLAFANTIRGASDGNLPHALALEADGTNATLRAAMITAGIAADDAAIVALDAATAAIAKTIETDGNLRLMATLRTTHADAITAAADALIAVP